MSRPLRLRRDAENDARWKEVYRRAVAVCHPDRAPAHLCEQMTKKTQTINDAWRRRDFDSLHTIAKELRLPDIPAPPPKPFYTKPQTRTPPPPQTATRHPQSRKSPQTPRRRDTVFLRRISGAAAACLCAAAFFVVVPGAIPSAWRYLPGFSALAAEQQYEAMSDKVRSSLRRQIDRPAAPRLFFADKQSGREWLRDMSARLSSLLPADSVLQNDAARRDFLVAVHYEAARAGLDPQLILAVMHVESAFRKYAISSAGARGLMQVMPFWVREIGDGDERKLFQLRANLRYGAVILRHYLDMENGDLNRALARYNGSLGKTKYPNLVHDKLQKYWTLPEAR